MQNIKVMLSSFRTSSSNNACRQHCIAKMPAIEYNSAFVILFNFRINAERQEFYFRHFGNALTLCAIFGCSRYSEKKVLQKPRSQRVNLSAQKFWRSGSVFL